MPLYKVTYTILPIVYKVLALSGEDALDETLEEALEEIRYIQQDCINVEIKEQ
jgi:hypothetical protein